MDVTDESLGEWRAAAKEQGRGKRESGSLMMFEQHFGGSPFRGISYFYLRGISYFYHTGNTV
jgi:hypothetical protein